MPKKIPSHFDAFAKGITSWVGSPASLFLHSVFFVVMLGLPLLGVPATKSLLILTTVVSLEAIYLSILIQYTVNQQGAMLDEVTEDIEDVTEDVKEISEDVEEITEDVREISEDVEEITEELHQPNSKQAGIV